MLFFLTCTHGAHRINSSILRNEKYIGDALLQKTYTVSVLDKKRVPNNGLVPKYYVEGSHEAIIDKDTFLRVQAELARRSSIKTGEIRKLASRVFVIQIRIFTKPSHACFVKMLVGDYPKPHDCRQSRHAEKPFFLF